MVGLGVVEERRIGATTASATVFLRLRKATLAAAQVFCVLRVCRHPFERSDLLQRRRLNGNATASDAAAAAAAANGAAAIGEGVLQKDILHLAVGRREFVTAATADVRPGNAIRQCLQTGSQIFSW